jgi:hypothetical protein
MKMRAARSTDAKSDHADFVDVMAECMDSARSPIGEVRKTVSKINSSMLPTSVLPRNFIDISPTKVSKKLTSNVLGNYKILGGISPNTPPQEK